VPLLITVIPCKPLFQLFLHAKEQQKIMDRLAQRFKEKGGMTAALSEKIGYGGA
jgi:hypothetical protein